MRDIGLAATGPLIWGTTYVATTLWLPPNRPLLAGLMRALPVGLLLLAVFRRLPPGGWWGRMLVLGVLNIGLFFPFFFIAVYRLPGGVAATLSAGQPFLVALFAWPLLQIRPAPRTLGLAASGIAGIGLLVLGPARPRRRGRRRRAGRGGLHGPGNRTDQALGAPGARAPVHRLATGGRRAAAGAPGPALRVARHVNRDQPGGLRLSGADQYRPGYANLVLGGGPLGAAAATFLMLLSPVVATLLGFLVLGQTLTPLQLGGALLVLASVAAGQLPTPAPRAPAPAVVKRET